MNTSFKEQHGRDPVAGVDYDPDAPMCQDDHDYLSGEGQYQGCSRLGRNGETNKPVWKVRLDARCPDCQGRGIVQVQMRWQCRFCYKEFTAKEMEEAFNNPSNLLPCGHKIGEVKEWDIETCSRCEGAKQIVSWFTLGELRIMMGDGELPENPTLRSEAPLAFP